MELINQVCSLELAKKLKELGVKQDSLFYLYEMDTGKFELYSDLPTSRDKFSAFTVAELGEMLPKGTWLEVFYHSLEVQVVNLKKVFQAKTEANARARMVVYLKENKLI